MIATNSVRWLLDDCCLYQQTEGGTFELNICELVGNLAYHAMMLEAHLTPKPGLVDCLSPGAHRDMDINTFVASADSLRPYMSQFVKTGYDLYQQPLSALLPELRKVGIEAERAMFRATSGINTHKGMIFTLGLICGAVGWLYHKESQYDSVRIRQVIQTCCAELVNDELINSKKVPATAGERLFRECGITGIRGEAVAGYPTIFNFGLPIYESAIAQGQSEEQAMFKTLLNLMAHNNDSNLVNRGGLEGLKFVQYQAKFFLSVYYLDDECFEQQMRVFDQELIDLNLSPGGSADLLAATWLLAQINLFNR